jgi:glycosyltransferase involved in cell wall biosynthesis
METYLGDLLRVSMRHGLEVGAVVHGKKDYPAPNPDDFGGAKIYTVPTHGQVLYAPVAPMFPVVLCKAIREFKPDILHMHVPNTSAFWALFIPEARKIPWVLHWHADVDVGRMRRVMQLAYQLYQPFQTALLQRARSVIATSREYLAASNALRPWQAKCCVIPLAIDPIRLVKPTDARVAAAAQLWPRPTETRFLAVGRLTYYKGYDFLIDAFRSAPKGSLVIVGDGELRDRLLAQIKSLELTDRVRLLGRLPDDQLAACFSAADVFCMSSIDRSEAYGVVLLEAAYLGLRIIASDIVGSATGRVAVALGGNTFPAADKRKLEDLLALYSTEGYRKKSLNDIALELDIKAYLENYEGALTGPVHN